MIPSFPLVSPFGKNPLFAHVGQSKKKQETKHARFALCRINRDTSDSNSISSIYSSKTNKSTPGVRALRKKLRPVIELCLLVPVRHMPIHVQWRAYRNMDKFQINDVHNSYSLLNFSEM